MKSFENYLLTLIGFSFLSTLTHSLLPDGNLKTSVKFVCGIIMSVLIIAPIPGISFDNFDIPSDDEAYSLYSESTDSVALLTREIITDKVSEIVKNCLESNNIFDYSLNVEFDENNNISKIILSPYDADIAKEISDNLGVPTELLSSN